MQELWAAVSLVLARQSTINGLVLAGHMTRVAYWQQEKRAIQVEVPAMLGVR